MSNTFPDPNLSRTSSKRVSSRTYAFEDPDLEAYRKDVVQQVSKARWLKDVCEKVLGRECSSVALVGSVLDPRSFHDSSDVDVAFSLEPQTGEVPGLSEELSYQLQMEMLKNPLGPIGVLNSLVFVGPIKTRRGKTLRVAKTAEKPLPNQKGPPRAILAKAEVPLRRQRTQYSCMSASMCACLNALGHKCDEDEVNAVMGARPMKGAAWEQALACAQHYGVRGTLVCPSTVPQLKSWTDAGKPVMIAWNPEGREWSHASVVFDVTDELPSPVPPECTVSGESGPWVWVADTNIPNPEKTVRIVSADHFYSKWFEKWPNYLVRRPALMLEREITSEGRQVMASSNRRGSEFNWQVFGADLREAFAKTKVPTRVVTGEEFPSEKIINIDLQFGRDYFDRPGWDDDKASNLIHKVALKHGLKPIGFPGEKYSTPDGRTIVVYVTASSSGGSPVRLASQKSFLSRFASWDSERRYDKLQELRSELWDESIEFGYFLRKIYFYLVALPGWAVTIDEPEIRIWVNQVLSGLPKVGFNIDPKPFFPTLKRKAWPLDISDNMYGGKNLSPESRKLIDEFINESLTGWPQKPKLNLSTVGKTYFQWYEDQIPQKLDKYKSLSSKYKPYVPPPNVRIPSAPIVKTVVDAATDEKIQILTSLLSKIQDLTISQVIEAYKAGAKPTDDQLKKIRNLLYRSRMAPEADKFRVASRPGPQWNPWPSSKFSLETEIDFWKSKLLPVRGTTILQDMYPEAGPKEVLLVKGLIEALENQDRKKAKSFATALEDKIPGVVGNTTWSYVLDGRKASVESVVSRHPTNLEKVSMAPQLNKEVLPNPVKTRDLGVQGLIERGGAGAGKHKNKQDFERGHARYPKHKGRGYDESMTESVKTASGGSLASFLRLWWSALEDQLVASAVVIGGDCSVKKLSNTLRARISLQDPFNEDRIMLGKDEPHVQVVLSLQEVKLGFMKVLILVVNEDRVVKKKEFTPEVMSKDAEELADLIFNAAMDLFENTEF